MAKSLTHQEKLELSHGIIDIFETFLEEKDIEIQNLEKIASDCPSNIFGTDYFNLEDGILEYLYRANIIARKDKKEDN